MKDFPETTEQIYCADDGFEFIFLNDNCPISIQIVIEICSQVSNSQ